MSSAITNYRMPRASRPTALQQVNFKDGMIITADDLATAVAYPLAVFQTLVRSFFGCGILCGLAVNVENGRDKKPSNVICVRPGTAIDCYGFPLELCQPVKLDLTPAHCDPWPERPVVVAMRRVTSDGAPRRDSGHDEDCGCNGGHHHDGDCGCNGEHSRGSSRGYECTRTKDHVLIQAFLWDDAPEGLCLHGVLGEDLKNGRPTGEECMKECGPCECCGESWIFLGAFTLDQKKEQSAVAHPDNDKRRKYVKPIECLFQPKTDNPPAGEAPAPLAREDDFTSPAKPEEPPPPAKPPPKKPPAKPE